jgi:hypothetical protein
MHVDQSQANIAADEIFSEEEIETLRAHIVSRPTVDLAPRVMARIRATSGIHLVRPAPSQAGEEILGAAHEPPRESVSNKGTTERLNEQRSAAVSSSRALRSRKR